MLEAPVEYWECRICGVERPVPCQNTGPGVPACGQCGKPMTKRMPPLVGSAGVIRDEFDLDHALNTMSGATDAMVHDILARDPDGVMEPMEDDDHE